MWYVFSRFLPFCFGLIFGVALMCFLQVGKDADERIEKMERKKEK